MALIKDYFEKTKYFLEQMNTLPEEVQDTIYRYKHLLE